MTFDYAKSRATADRLIKRFGQSGFIRREVPGAGPPYNPGPPTITDYQADLVVVDYTADEVDGTRVLATDKKVLIAVGGLEISPRLTDRVIDALGTVYAIASLKPVAPGGVVLIVEAQCRL